MTNKSMRLAFGPILTYWPKLKVFDFYQEVAQGPANIVYLGETVCSRRHELRVDDWLDIAELLAGHGKEVVLSTQALIESPAELTAMRRIAGHGRYLVEANDMGAVHCLGGVVPFVAGPHLNVYHPRALAMLAEQGAQRWVLPMELGRAQVAIMAAARPRDVQIEVFAYGRMPLAFSARCFTARNRNLPKDDCRFSCMEHPDGLQMRTREGVPFLVLNGTQTQSARLNNLIRELPAMAALGVNVVRVSPQSEGTGDVLATFERVLRGELDPQAAYASLTGDFCDGYWFGGAGMEVAA